MTEEDAYKQALEELQAHRVVEGVWAKSIAFSEGDARRAKANYLRFRAEQILKDAGVLVPGTSFAGIVRQFLSPRGRIGRVRFAVSLLICLGGGLLCLVLLSANEKNVGPLTITMFLLCGAFSLWALLAAHIKRVRSAGLSQIVLLTYVIPYVGALIVVLMLLMLPEAQTERVMRGATVEEETDGAKEAEPVQPKETKDGNDTAPAKSSLQRDIGTIIVMLAVLGLFLAILMAIGE